MTATAGALAVSLSLSSSGHGRADPRPRAASSSPRRAPGRPESVDGHALARAAGLAGRARARAAWTSRESNGHVARLGDVDYPCTPWRGRCSPRRAPPRRRRRSAFFSVADRGRVRVALLEGDARDGARGQGCPPPSSAGGGHAPGRTPISIHCAWFATALGSWISNETLAVALGTALRARRAPRRRAASG